jgi:molybdopterin-guanine dinucleotide biosynthesis protein A
MGLPPLAWQPGGDATTQVEAAAAGPETVGVVLAGGGSRRMGRDKAELAVGGSTLTARAAHRLLRVCTRVAIADRGRGLMPDLPNLADGPGAGPAAGILGAALAWPGHPLLVLACDLPRVSEALLQELARRLPAAGDGDAGDADWVVPRWERGLEPLCALYLPAALAALAAAVARGVAAPHRLAEATGLKVRYLEGERLRRFGPPADLFLNLNTARDLERWQRLEPGEAIEPIASLAPAGGANPLVGGLPVSSQPPSASVFSPPAAQAAQGHTWRRKSKR